MSGTTVIGPRTVEVSGVDKELEKIWKTLAPPTDDDSQPVMHASVVNLVVVADTGAEADSSIDVLARVMSKSPCRAIVLDSQPEAEPPSLEANVSVICEKVGERQICCEHIRIVARGIETHVLPRTVESFYAPDLPIMIWWQAGFDRADLLEFAAVADRLVIDSMTFKPGEMKQLADLVGQSHKLSTAVSDLNWARLTPYRQLFTQFFDSPDWREKLKSIESVNIEATETAGLLMKGWLLSRLGQEPLGLKPEQINLQIGADEHRVFRCLSMKCGQGEFGVYRTSADTVEARVTLGGDTVTRVSRVPLASIEKLLVDEIGRSGRDRGYDGAIKMGLA
jgi:glucose-6-phosphate dehydrogenase assembly protein OpcA